MSIYAKMNLKPILLLYAFCLIYMPFTILYCTFALDSFSFIFVSLLLPKEPCFMFVGFSSF